MNILIIDDHPLTCHGLASLLAATQVGANVMSAHTVVQARAQMAGATPPDWLFLDINLPDDAQRTFFHSLCDTPWISKTILISAETPHRLLRAALGAGVRGFIPKTADPDLILDGFSAIRSGQVFVPPHLMQQLRSSPLSGEEAKALSPRLRGVQACVVRGAPNKVIARELCLSEHTVKEYVSSLLAYHGVANRLELVLKLQTQLHLGTVQ